MPPYNNAPGAAVPKLEIANPQPGPPGYACGFRNPGPNTRLIVNASSVASNVVTLYVTVVEGNIPLVGQTIYIYATTNNSAGLNDNTGTITVASATIATNGTGTITYAKTTANLGKTNDVGYALVVPGDITESIAVVKTQQFALGGFGLSWEYFCPSQPGSIAIQLEGSIDDVDADYVIIGTSQTSVSGATVIVAQVPNLVRFVRLHVTATAGGSSPTIIGKIQGT